MKARQQSTTAHPIPFLMVQSADHLTGLTGASPTVTLSKDGGAFAGAAGAVTEIGSGWYALAGNATDRNTLGELAIHATAASGDPTDEKYVMVAFDPFDSVRLGLTALPNAVPQAAGGLITSTAGSLDLDEMNVDIEAIQTSTAGLTFTGAGKVDASVRDWVGDTIPARNVAGVPIVDDKYLLGTVYATPATAGIMDVNSKNVGNVAQTGADVGALATEINADADELITSVAALPTTTLDAAGVRSALGLASANLDTQLAEIEGETDDIAAVKTKTDQFVFTVANQVDANALSGAGLSAAGVRAAVGLASANLDTQLAEIESETDDIAAIPTNPLLTTDARLNDLDATISSRLAGASYTAPDNAGITEIGADVDELITTLGAAGAGLTAIPDSAAVVEIGADVDAIQAKTDQLVFTVANQVDANALTGGGISAAGVRAAVGLASANLDTQLGEIGADADELIATVGVAGAGLTAIPAVDHVTNYVGWVSGDVLGDVIGAVGRVEGNIGALAEQAQTDVRTSIGLATANLDTQLAEIETDVDALPTDAQLIASHGAGAWGAAAPAGTYTITFSITDQSTSNPLADVLITLKDASDTSILDQQRTNGLGVATSSLNAATYKVHVGPIAGYSAGIHTLVVSANASVAYTLTPFAIGSPSAMNLCRVYGYEYLNGNPIRGRSVWAQLAGLPHTTSGAILDGSQTVTASDLAGYWFLDLVIGQTYRVSVQEAGIELAVLVPDQVSVNLSTLIP